MAARLSVRWQAEGAGVGPYPAVSLYDARRGREEAKRLLAEGTDPAAERKREKLTQRLSSATTFRRVADEWLAKLEREGCAAVTITKKRWLLELVDGIGSRPIAELTPPEVLSTLRGIESKGCYETAGRARATIGAVCRYAIATGRAIHDPTEALRGALIAPRVAHHSAITDPKEIGALMRAIDGFQGAPQVEAATASSSPLLSTG